MLAAYQEMRRKLAEITASVESTRVTVESPDGLARATIGARGELLDLWISPERYRRVDSQTLAGTIRSTIAEARRQFSDQAVARYRSVLGPEFDVEQLLGGVKP